MPDNEPKSAAEEAPRTLTPEAKRALAEAEARRAAQADLAAKALGGDAQELGGPRGLEPTRYGDWERKGLAVDF